MKKSIKIFLDDLRVTPSGWIRCYWPEEVIFFLNSNHVSYLSLDHDLGDTNDKERTGYDVLSYLEKQAFDNPFCHIPNIIIHSGNNVGQNRMLNCIKSIKRFSKINFSFEFKVGLSDQELARQLENL